jgi:hypothetical protein
MQFNTAVKGNIIMWGKLIGDITRKGKLKKGHTRVCKLIGDITKRGKLNRTITRGKLKRGYNKQRLTKGNIIKEAN